MIPQRTHHHGVRHRVVLGGDLSYELTGAQVVQALEANNHHAGGTQPSQRTACHA